MKKILIFIIGLALITGSGNAQLVKISELPTGGALSSGDLYISNQSGATVSVTAAQMKTFMQAGMVASSGAGTVFLAPNGNGAALTGLTWSQIGGTPTTAALYGITGGAKLDLLAGTNPFSAGSGISFSGTWPNITFNASVPVVFATASGTNIYTATPSPALTSYATGQTAFITFTNGNTGGASLNLNSIGAASIHQNGSAIISGQIPAGATVELIFDGTNWQIVGTTSGSYTASTGVTLTGNAFSVNYGTTSGTALQGNALSTDGTMAADSNTLVPSQAAVVTYVAGHAGTVAWELKNANFTAVAGHKYQIDSSGGAITVTLPASASVGDAIDFADAKLSWNTNNVTLSRNGLNINNGTTNYTASVQGNKLSAVYISSGYGWSIK